MGNLERIDIQQVRIHGPGLTVRQDLILTGPGWVENGVYTGVCGETVTKLWPRNDDQLMLELQQDAKVLWRACYLRSSLVNHVGIEKRGDMALVSLSACQEYWPDFGPKAQR